MSLPNHEIPASTPPIPETTGEVLITASTTTEVPATTVSVPPTLSTPATTPTVTPEVTAPATTQDTPFTDQEAVQHAGAALKASTATEIQEAIAAIRDHYRQISQG